MTSDSSGDRPATLSREQLKQIATDRASLLDQLSEGVIVAGIDGKLSFVNQAAERLHGVSTLDVAPDAYAASYSLFTMDGEPYPSEQLPLARAVVAGKTVVDARWRIRRPDGSEVVALGSARPLIADGRQIGSILNLRDDSERFEAERKLRASEERFQLALNAASAIGTWDWDVQNDLIFADARFAEFFSVDPERAAVGAPVGAYFEGIHRGDHERVRAAIEQALASGEDLDIEYRVVTGGKADRWVLVRGLVSHNEAGVPVRIRGVVVDITRRNQAEQALRESEQRIATMLDSAAGAFYSVDGEGITTLVNRGFLKMMGFANENEVLGRKLHGLIHHSHPDGSPYPVEQCPIYLCAATGVPAHVAEEAFFRPDGSAVPVEYWVAPVMLGDEQIGAICTILDLTDRKRAEQAVRERSEEFYTLADNIPTLAWMAYANGDIFWYNRRWHDFTGTSADDLEGWGWEAVLDPAILPSVVERWKHSVETGEPFEMVFPLKSAQGPWRSFLTRIIPIRNHEGAILRWFGTGTDITDQLDAEQILRAEIEQRVAAESALTLLNETLEMRVATEIEARTAAEDALRQSQKMETLGQLTGGIAHDFNNLLQIIAGNLDILRRNLPQESARLMRTIDNAMKGADRAAVLTQRLLAFSRRQPLAPKVIDPNKLVAGMSEMLHRTLGELYAIETVLASGLWRVEADPNQLESALLNLAVNARDAMSDGGKLTIETANTHLDRSYTEIHSGVFPGQYVVICVSDTGTGMDRATTERAFEPFFTTKDVGKGTGLGLSMVYGFVKQSEGHLKIYSEPGEGTSVKIYLPRHRGAESDPDDSMADIRAPEGDAGATILVCEDDEDVRALSAESLRELGYRVIEAEHGEAALRLLESGVPVEILFTDVVLPGISGAVLADRAREARPGLKVLFTTGYARNAIVHHGRLDPGVELLSKPFTYSELAARIRDLIDAR